MVSWTTHDLLSLDWDRWSEYHGAHEVMNGAIAQVLDALSDQVWPFGLARWRLSRPLSATCTRSRSSGRSATPAQWPI